MYIFFLPYLKYVLEQKSMSQSIILIKWNYNYIKASAWKCDTKMRIRTVHVCVIVYCIWMWSDVLSPLPGDEERTNCNQSHTYRGKYNKSIVIKQFPKYFGAFFFSLSTDKYSMFGKFIWARWNKMLKQSSTTLRREIHHLC